MKRLYLMRHAKAEAEKRGLDDFDRGLTARGREDAAQLGGYLKREAIRPAHIICSASLRTRQTLELMTPALEGIPNSFERRIYEAEPENVLEVIGELGEEIELVLLIGHNPSLQIVALSLAGNTVSAVMAMKFPTCAMAALSTGRAWDALRPGSCRLESFVSPKELGSRLR